MLKEEQLLVWWSEEPIQRGRIWSSQMITPQDHFNP